MIIQRIIDHQFKKLMQKFPIVTVMGPRQSGKTTLVRHSYPDKPYINLEEPDTREIILNDPRSFFQSHPEGAILDEIQRAPILMSYIQSIVDNKETSGQFILTGSHQLELHQSITQSLAGRTALLELLPLTIEELRNAGFDFDLDEYLLSGFYPGIYRREQDPTVAYRNYTKTYIERDVRQLLNIQDLNSFQRFIQLCASRIGSILNVESLSNEVGKSHNTIKNWLSILQASYLTYSLQPYFENFGKRIIKSPKLYFEDVGLVSFLLGLDSTPQIKRDRLRGSLFENLVIVEIIKHYLNLGNDPQIYYYRDNHQNEIDVILKHHQYLIPIEIKSTMTFNSHLMKNIQFYFSLVKERAPLGFVIYNGEQEIKMNNIYFINYKNLNKVFQIIHELL